jgi:integration host factor subunit beta
LKVPIKRKNPDKEQTLMKTINKDMLTKGVSEDTAIHPNLVKEVINSFLNQIKDEYKKGNRIELREFGIFTPYIRNPRKYTSMKTGETKKMTKKKMLKFKCSRQLHI